MVDKTVLHNLKSGMVLDRDLLINQSADDLSHIIQTIREAGQKPVYVVDNSENLFTMGSLVSLINKKSPLYSVVNEALGDFFTPVQIGVLLGQDMNNIIAHDQAKDQLNNGDVVIDLEHKHLGYKFDPVPQGWSVSGNMSLGPTKIKRKVKNSDGDGTMFYMEPKEFEKLWLHASKVWFNAPNVAPSVKVYTGLGNKTAYVKQGVIDIGGNFIRRYEIEQVAKHRGWVIPGNAAVVAA